MVILNEWVTIQEHVHACHFWEQCSPLYINDPFPLGTSVCFLTTGDTPLAAQNYRQIMYLIYAFQGGRHTRASLWGLPFIPAPR